MELETVKKLLVRFLEAEPMTDEEGRQLLAAFEALIERNEHHLLLGLKYRSEDNKVLSEDELQGVYWELDLYYGDHDDDHHHDHDDDELPPARPDVIHKWGWLFALLVGLGAAIVYTLIRQGRL